jgi:ABC-type sugar transport system permease subunit
MMALPSDTAPLSPPLAVMYITRDDVTVQMTDVSVGYHPTGLMAEMFYAVPAPAAAKRKHRLLGALGEHIAWGWLAAAVVWLLVWGVVAVYGYLWALLLLLGDALTGASDAWWALAVVVVWWVFGMVMLAALVMRSSK